MQRVGNDWVSPPKSGPCSLAMFLAVICCSICPWHLQLPQPKSEVVETLANPGTQWQCQELRRWWAVQITMSASLGGFSVGRTDESDSRHAAFYRCQWRGSASALWGAQRVCRGVDWCPWTASAQLTCWWPEMHLSLRARAFQSHWQQGKIKQPSQQEEKL